MTREHYDEMLRALDNQILSMGELVRETIGHCVDALDRIDVEEAGKLIARDSEIDEQRYAIENSALLLIATQQPLASDLRTVASILTIATELERIGDYCEGIAKLTLRMAGEPSRSPLTDIHTMAATTQRLLHEVLIAYRDRDVDAAGSVWSQDDAVDELYQQVFRSMIAGMATDKTTIRWSTYLLWVAHNIERMADRVTNIAERVAFVVTGEVATFRGHLRAQTLPH